MDRIDNVAKEFNSAELVLVAEQCGLAPTSRWGQRQVIEAIIAKIDKDGIPDPPHTDVVEELGRGEVLLEEFLWLAGYVDDNGNPVERKAAKLPLTDYMTLHNISKKPDCWSFADDRDPACQRCLLYIYCGEQRLANLPPCFAVLWDANEAECSVCIDAAFCKEAVLAKKQRQESNNG